MLNEREFQILDVINDYIEANGFSSTVRELCEIVGLKSSSTIHNHLNKLEFIGFITKMGNSLRTLKVLKTLEKMTT